jgi:hypothetical protein
MPLPRLGAVVALALATVFAPSAAAAGGTCVVLQVRNAEADSRSTVDRVELPAVAATRLGVLPYQLNALGYAPAQDLAYGMTDGGDVVTVDRRGRTSDLGPVRGAERPDFAGATSGAIAGNIWYVMRAGILSTVDVKPGGTDYLRLRGTFPAHPWVLASQVDDFDFDPVRRLLYGVAATPGGGVVVSLDPGTGLVQPLPGPRLPPSTAFGAVTLAPDGALFVTANDIGGRSRTYRVLRQGPATELATGPPLAGADAGGCLPALAPPPDPPPAVSTPPTTPPPAPPLPPLPAPPPPTTTPPPQAVIPARPPVFATSSRAPRTPSSTRHMVPSTKKPPDATDARARETQTQRRWAIAVLVLVLGASIVARRIGR